MSHNSNKQGLAAPVYDRDGITIYCGDCAEILPTLPAMAGLAFTSPPYNMRTRVRNGQYASRELGESFSRKYAHFGDDLPVADYYKLHRRAINQMMRISGLVFWNIQIVTGSKEAVFRLMGKFSKSIKDIIVWDKGHGQPAMHPAVLNKAAELIIIFEGNATAGRAFSRSFFKRGEMPDIWRMGGGNNTHGHGATFPTELVSRAIAGWSTEGDTILDPFMGTGSAMVAARNMGRRGVGIEISGEYCRLAVDSLRQKTLWAVPAI